MTGFVAVVGSAAWEREVAIEVIARLLDEPDRAEARRMAEVYMRHGEEAAIERDQRLREIAREVTREFGFEDPKDTSKERSDRRR